MKSNYKPLGKYIRPVDERNTDLLDLPLMGLSVSKVFFPTIANLVGTDMRTYKIAFAEINLHTLQTLQDEEIKLQLLLMIDLIKCLYHKPILLLKL